LASQQAYRLPTDAEWSFAVDLNEPAGGTPREKDGKIQGVYPWGTQWPPPKGAGNYSPGLQVDDYDYTSPVGSFAANRYGLYDLGGNVWEWCEGFYDGKSGARVLRGASWRVDIPDYLLSSFRNGGTPVGRRDNVGFRVLLAGGVSVQAGNP
jgi:formylglycine-generating enzyme required for sulfatase activity